MAKKILLIESDPVVTKILQYCFSKESDLELLITLNAEEGVPKALETNPELILIDVMLPLKSGIEAIKKIRENASTKKTPIIAFSHLNQKTLIDEALKAGANEYIVKGFDSIDEVFLKVKKLIGS